MKMRYSITFLFLLVAVAAFSQRTPVSEQVSLRWGYNPQTGDSTFYETRTITYTDGTQSSDEAARGDTAAVVNVIAIDAINKSKKFSGAANEVWQKDVVIDYILQANTLLSGLGTSIIEYTIGLYGDQVDSTSWDIVSADMGTFTGLLTIAPGGGALRMRIGTTNYTLLPVGDAWIRFQNFPPGSFTDLHRVNEPGKLEFRNISQSLIISQR